MKNQNSSQWLKHDYKVTLKKFYKWYCKEDSLEITRWIKTTVKKKGKKLPDYMLSESDVLNLVKSVEHQRDKGMVYFLSDIRAKIGEIDNNNYQICFF